MIKNKFPTPLKRIYHRVRLTIWAIFNLPRRLYVADTPYSFFAWNWMVALLCKTASTKIKGNQMWYEPNEHPHFVSMIKKGDIFFDVGAMIGYYCLLAAGHGASKVFAFEIIEEYTKFIRRTFKENNINGEVFNCAIGGEGEVLFEDTLARNKAKTIQLDTIAQSVGYPTVMKMDIEGYELDALRTAEELLKRKPRIDISIHPLYLEKKGQLEYNVIELLNNYGYKKLWQYQDTHFYQV